MKIEVVNKVRSTKDEIGIEIFVGHPFALVNGEPVSAGCTYIYCK